MKHTRVMLKGWLKWEGKNACCREEKYLAECYILTCIYIYIYTCIYMRKESQRHNDKGRAKTSLKKYTSHLIVRFACERELETEQRLQHIDLTSPSWHSRVSFSFSRAAQLEARGPTLLAFSTASYHLLVWSPTPSGVSRAPSAGCGFPYHISSLTRLISNSSDLQLTRGPRGPPPPGGGFLYHILSLISLVPYSLTSCLHRVI